MEILGEGEIQTTRMKRIPIANSSLEAFVSDRDYSKVAHIRWILNKDGYARMSKRPHSMMYHVIMGYLPKKFEWDHRDTNKLNNQRSNLRISSHSQNRINRSLRKDNASGFKGVSWNTKRKTWVAQASFGGRQHLLGDFSDPILAAKAYDVAVLKEYGKFARPNFPMRFPRLKVA